MEMEVFTKPIVSAVVGLLKEYLVNYFKSEGNTEEDFEKCLSQYMREIDNWSNIIQFLDMPTPKGTDIDTIMLPIRMSSRRSHRKDFIVTNERIFLTEPDHYMLLGDPGSGKTTTVKRLVRCFFDKPISGSDLFQYPVVLLLRKYDPQLGLFKSIAQTIGVRYHDIKISGTENVVTMIGDKNIREALPAILDTTRAYILLDGLDEVPYSAYDELMRQVSDLAHSLDKSKILITCRTGDFNLTLEGFNVLHLTALNQSQIQKIANMWLGDSKAFIKEVNDLPYKDMIQRPLLLVQLLYIFQSEGELPREPNTIYHYMLTLLLKDWDRSRGILRKTDYAKFNPDVKIKFLSSLSYELTYKIKTKRFSGRQLTQCYTNICSKHGLPEGQAVEVAKEIETHTGIIVGAGKFDYEFSHLSLQEYLCANYIVKEPRAAQIISYINEYPAPIAIAIALASEPSTWFADLILRFGDKFCYADRSLTAFVSRLLIERPCFVASVALGYAMLNLYFESHKQNKPELTKHIESLHQLPYVVESISSALSSYSILKPESEPGDYFSLVWQSQNTYDRTPGYDFGFTPPLKGYLPKHILLKAIRQHLNTMYWCNEWGKSYGRFDITNDSYSYNEQDGSPGQHSDR
jgi:hypothetical protein